MATRASTTRSEPSSNMPPPLMLHTRYENRGTSSPHFKMD